MSDGFDQFRLEFQARLEEETRKTVQAMRAVVDRAVKAETRKFLSWVADAYLGRPQAPELQAISGAWERLSRAYTDRRSKRRPNARGFWQYDGDLFTDLKKIPDANVLFGNPTVRNIAAKDGTGGFNRLIIITPFRDVNYLLQHGKWAGVDNFLPEGGDDEDDPRLFLKLHNRGRGGQHRPYRPLLGPAMIAYRNKIDSAVRMALVKNGYWVK